MAVVAIEAASIAARTIAVKLRWMRRDTRQLPARSPPTHRKCCICRVLLVVERLPDDNRRIMPRHIKLRPPDDAVNQLYQLITCMDLRHGRAAFAARRRPKPCIERRVARGESLLVTPECPRTLLFAFIRRSEHASPNASERIPGGRDCGTSGTRYSGCGRAPPSGHSHTAVREPWSSAGRRGGYEHDRGEATCLSYARRRRERVGWTVSETRLSVCPRDSPG